MGNDNKQGGAAGAASSSNDKEVIPAANSNSASETTQVDVEQLKKEHAQQVEDLQNQLIELNKKLKLAEMNKSTDGIIIKVKDDSYRIVSGVTMKLNGEAVTLTASEIAKNDDAIAKLIATKSDVLVKQ